MLDQTFSAENFRKIYDLQNRRGHNVDKLFFPDVAQKNTEITAKSQSVRQARKEYKQNPTPQNQSAIDTLRSELGLLRLERDTLIDAAIDNVALDVASGYQIELVTSSGPNGMALHTLPDEPSAYFIGKQLQQNISQLYKLRAGNRRAIVSQVRDALGHSFNQFVIRTDISSFYESINRSLLLREMEQDQILSWASKRFIKQCLKSYGAATQSALGLPRGLGLSAYLSELYMRSVDREIMQLPDLTYYARYVDDIIAIFSPSSLAVVSDYPDKIKAAIERKQLTMNPAKTDFGSCGGNISFSFDYLGYRFTVSGGKCTTEISQNKLARYRKRITNVFSIYERDAMRDQKSAARLLVSRIKFLTTNTRLYNNKSHAFTGVYFNNSHLTKLNQLTSLDAYLNYKIGLLSSAQLQNRLVDFSFRLGFIERRYSRFSAVQLAKIVEAWRYES